MIQKQSRAADKEIYNKNIRIKQTRLQDTGFIAMMQIANRQFLQSAEKF
jgi:hypothetical protein